MSLTVSIGHSLSWVFDAAWLFIFKDPDICASVHINLYSAGVSGGFIVNEEK